MATLCLNIRCYDFEKSKEDVITQLDNSLKFLNELNTDFDVTLIKSGNNLKSEDFSTYIENFKNDVIKYSFNDDDIIEFKDVSIFPTSKGDIEEKELEFEDSLSISIAWGTTVDCIRFKMKLDMTSDDAHYEIESLSTDYGLDAEINDENGNYLEFTV